MKAIVVGAGIGGLTTALSMHGHGVDVDVFEQADAVGELGVGFNILPPAVGELAGLGLLDDLDAVGIRTGALVMTTRRGQTVLRDRRGLAGGAPFPQFSIHRGHLQRVLADALDARAGSRVVHLDHRLAGFEQDERRVRASFVHRSGTPGRTVAADVLIGADGIRSAVRAQLFPGEGEPVVAATNPIYEYPMCDREPLSRWSHGRVTLLGDAAHPMYPMGSNGATQAIIDAANVAARLAESGGDVADALRAYECDRREATSRLVLMNRTGGPERVIDLVEQLAPEGFEDIDDVIAADELRRIVSRYAAATTPRAATA